MVTRSHPLTKRLTMLIHDIRRFPRHLDMLVLSLLHEGLTTPLTVRQNTGLPAVECTRIFLRLEAKGLIAGTGAKRGRRYRITGPGNAVLKTAKQLYEDM